jgi:ketosteroid isomerase-like protein
MTIRETFDALFRAVTADRDGEAFANLWLVDDPTITMWGSDLDERAIGADAVRKLGAAIAASKSELRFAWDDVAVHERGEVAWVNASGRIEVDGAPHPYRVTGIMLQTFAGWRWHTFHGSVPD